MDKNEENRPFMGGFVLTMQTMQNSYLNEDPYGVDRGGRILNIIGAAAVRWRQLYSAFI